MAEMDGISAHRIKVIQYNTIYNEKFALKN